MFAYLEIVNCDVRPGRASAAWVKPTKGGTAMNRIFVVAAVGMTMLCTAASPAHATPELFSQAKSSGMPVKNCQYCHVSTIPKKETFKPEDLNPRGKWLLDERDKTKSPNVNVQWLKNYPGGE
jgi:hypothetical protein